MGTQVCLNGPGDLIKMAAMPRTATPGLQGIALIHYTTEASQSSIGQG